MDLPTTISRARSLPCISQSSPFATIAYDHDDSTMQTSLDSPGLTHSVTNPPISIITSPFYLSSLLPLPSTSPVSKQKVRRQEIESSADRGEHGGEKRDGRGAIYQRTNEPNDHRESEVEGDPGVDAPYLLTYDQWQRFLNVSEGKDENGRWRTTKLPMIFFSNERSLLAWMRVSTTLGVIAIGITFLSSPHTRLDIDSRFIVTRASSLLLLLVSILLTCFAYRLFRRRERLIHEGRETSECYSNVWMPRLLTLGGVALMGSVWISTLVRLYHKA